MYSNVADQPVYDFQYELEDHLGNTRVVFNQAAPGVAQVLQLQQYYAFGLQMGDYTMNYVGTTKDLYGYNGKEEQPDQGLDWIDYGARFYDAELGRWHVVDALAEKAPDWSPYRYGFDNPIKFIDPTGMNETNYVDEEGKTIVNTNDGINKTVMVSNEYRNTFDKIIAVGERNNWKDDKSFNQQVTQKVEEFNTKTIDNNSKNSNEKINSDLSNAGKLNTPAEKGGMHDAMVTNFWSTDMGKDLIKGVPFLFGTAEKREAFGNIRNGIFEEALEKVINWPFPFGPVIVPGQVPEGAQPPQQQ